MIECLNWSGKMPDEKDKLMMLVMVGTRAVEQAFRREVGMGSNSQYLLGDVRSALVTSSSVTGWNSSRLDGADVGGGS